MCALSFVFYGLAYHPVLGMIAALALALFMREHADAGLTTEVQTRQTTMKLLRPE